MLLCFYCAHGERKLQVTVKFQLGNYKVVRIKKNVLQFTISYKMV